MIAPGTLVGKRYTIIEHVGRGGMQDVYRAQDELLKRPVALKTPQLGQTKRFARSAKIAALVNHHNVAKTYDYDEDENHVFIVEEFVDGDNLEQRLGAFGFLDPHLAARVFHHLAKGISASHRVGVIHRDLKPSNVMTDGTLGLSVVKITDFGIATLTEQVFEEAREGGDLSKSASGSVKGALPYMAPELMFKESGDTITTAVDVWSLGAMMFRLMTGEYPFGVFLKAAVNVQTRNRHAWPDFMLANPQFKPLAKELQILVEQCLEYEPNARPSAQDIVLKCADLCYLVSERHEAVVTRLIQHGYSGNASSARGNLFFSMESVYGPKRPVADDRICCSSFPGTPYPRAHPVLVLPGSQTPEGN